MLIVDCPSCAARFRVPVDAVPVLGRDMRCSSCRHVWHYVPVVSDLDHGRVGDPIKEIEEETPGFLQDEQPISNPDLSVQPAIGLPQQEVSSVAGVDQAPIPDLPIPPPMTRRSATPLPPPSVGPRIAGYVAAILGACLIFYVLVMGQRVMTMIVPRLAVLYQLWGVYVPPVTPMVFDKINMVRDVNQITITGVLINQTDIQRNIPSIRAILLNDQGQAVATWVFRADKNFADVAVPVPFKIARELDHADRVQSVRLEFVPATSK